MPLTQSTLRFPMAASLPDPVTTSLTPSQPAQLSRSSTASSETLPGEPDGDTIVVGGLPRANPLPTPSDTTADSLSECGRILNLKNVTHGHGTRLTKFGEQFEHSQDCLLESTDGNKMRSVSGETLVASTSQSSLLQEGIAALNLPWNMSSIFKSSSQTQLLMQEEKTTSIDSMQLAPNDAERAAKAVAKNAKMEENAKLREARIKAADEKATRRSNRASMMERAGDMMSDLAASVLGKRPRDASEMGKDRLNNLKKRASLRPTSMIEPVSATTPAFEGPMAKRRRLSDGDLGKSHAQSDSFTIPRKPLPVRKEKKWLRSGLYTGQMRDFDGRLTESKNKRKYDAKDVAPIRENKVLPLPMFAGDRLLKQGRDFKLPFDVFSPLPAGQPKPDEWKKTNKNVFIGDAAQFWRTTKLQEHSTCICQPETGCDSDCMNRFMFYECDHSNCRLTEGHCGNRSFEGLRQRVKKGGKYNVGVEVIKTSDRGYGVRSNRTFEPNQIIVEYTGEIITQEEADNRMNNLYKENECFYLMLFDQNMIIDATRGSIARFVNHSCAPNCRMEKWTVGGKPRMALFAGDGGIMTGDELTYDYNFDPFSQKNVQICRCGAKNCRGILGPKAKEEKKPKDDASGSANTSSLAGAKRKLAQIFDESSRGFTKKRKVVTTKGSRSSSVIKKVSIRSSNLSPKRAINRKPSVLKRIVNSAKDKTTQKRTVSSSSASRLLLPQSSSRPLSRRESVKAKAETIRRNVARTVKGGRGDN